MGGVALADGGFPSKSVSANPDAGKTDAERDAEYAGGRASFDQRYAAWIAALDIAKVDFNTIPRLRIMASYVPPPPTLGDAVRAADIIVVGHVTGFHAATSGSSVTFAVERVIKGAPGPTIEVYQGASLQPTPDWNGATLAEGENAYSLLPGTSALLVLTRDGASGRLYPESFTGTYLVTNGRLTALPLNPFASTLDAVTVDEAASKFAAFIRP